MSDYQNAFPIETRLTIALEMVRDEYLKARQKHGVMNSGHEGYAVIKEELEELWDLVKRDEANSIDAYDEAKQVAAMGIAFMLEVAG